MKRTIEASSRVLLAATAVLISILASGTAQSLEITSPSAKASTEFVRLTREAVDKALAPGASQQDIKRAEELLFGVGWMALYGNTGEQLFMQKWYLAMPAGGPDVTRFNALREVANYEIDTTVLVSPELVGVVWEVVGKATSENPGPDDFRVGEAFFMALGWMALYGNDDESSALGDRMATAAAGAWPNDDDVYFAHTSEAYFQIINLGHFPIPTDSPDPTPVQSANAMELLARGTGKVSAPDGTHHPAFELWGYPDGFQVMAIRFDVDDTPFEIALAASSDGGNRGSGLLTPCADGVCPCSLEGDEQEGWISGFCGNTAHPEHGEIRFDIQIGDRQASSQPQWPMLVTGTGTVTAQGETRDTMFEIWGDDQQARLIKMDAGGDLFEITVDEGDSDSKEGWGEFSPCDGDCPCYMSEIEGGIRGTCTNPAKPDEGELRFTMQIDGQVPATQQWATLASGPGEVIAQGETRAANFEILGDDEQAWLIKIDTEGMAFEIAVAEADVGGSVGKGQLSPCDGGDCPCTMTEIEGGIEGSCSNRAYPEHGDMRFTMGRAGQQSPPIPPVVPRPTAGGSVPVSARLRLQSDRIPVSRSDPTYTAQQLDIVPAIYLDVVFSDGTTVGPHDYHKKFAGNVIFDDVTGDPNDIIKVSYWDLDSNRPDLGKFAAQLTSTGKGVGSATLKVSLRDAPGITAWVPVTVVGTPPRQAAPVPVVPPPSTVQNQTPKKMPVAMELSLQSTTILTRTTYFQKTYNGPGQVDPAIYIDVTFSDGTKMGPHDYQQQFAGNLVFDDTSGDPNDLIHVSYWDVNGKLPSSKTPGPGRYAAQLSAPGYGTGNATLKVSLRNAPGVTASIPVTVVGTPERAAAPPPVVAPPPTAQPTPAQPQLTLITNGSGDFNDAGAEFGIWGLNGNASEIRIQTGRGNYVFTIDQNSSNEDKLRGRLTPCSGGGCSCEMFEEGQNYYMGFCDAADPQNQFSFSFRLN